MVCIIVPFLPSHKCSKQAQLKLFLPDTPIFFPGGMKDSTACKADKTN